MSDLFLKSCPFCGGKAAFESVERLGYAVWSVGCMNEEEDCIAGQMIMTFSRKQEAAEAWNKRVIVLDQKPLRVE